MAGCIHGADGKLELFAVGYEDLAVHIKVEVHEATRHHAHLPPVTGLLQRLRQQHRHVARLGGTHVGIDAVGFLLLLGCGNVGIKDTDAHVEQQRLGNPGLRLVRHRQRLWQSFLRYATGQPGSQQREPAEVTDAQPHFAACL